MRKYDHVQCISPLLPSQYRGQSFQTKELDGEHDDYTITEDGFLRREPIRDGWRKNAPAVIVWIDGQLWLSPQSGEPLRAVFSNGRLQAIQSPEIVQSLRDAFEVAHNGGKTVDQIDMECHETNDEDEDD